jgi:hypothetical protein
MAFLFILNTYICVHNYLNVVAVLKTNLYCDSFQSPHQGGPKERREESKALQTLRFKMQGMVQEGDCKAELISGSVSMPRNDFMG